MGVFPLATRLVIQTRMKIMFEKFRDDQWKTKIEDEVFDPILVALLIDLGTSVEKLAGELCLEEYIEFVLEVCRDSRAIRLHAGKLNKMQPAAKETMSEDLTTAKAIIESRSDVPDAKKYQEAIHNIVMRLNLIHKVESPILAAVGANEGSSVEPPAQPR